MFLCGAGVSAPQLPGFQRLVERTFEKLNVTMSPSEKNSFEDGRYEEVLGSLSRRIVNSEEMLKAIVDLLKIPEAPNLDNHRTILRLSRNLENDPLIVTTNFDTLLEHALLCKENDQVVRMLSVAGQDLPAPGSPSFRGIIHLHGRLAAEDVKLPQTPLVITSADYGDAYMRSGWASRFLFDLCRCKTVVLVGYSAGDAPVRYFLNLLEADRQRFPELCPVYALDAVKAGDREEAETRWGALAVKPIAYEKEPDAAGNLHHTALWRDLAELADLVERPSLTRRLWSEKILSKPFRETGEEKKDLVAWLYRDSRDLWATALKVIKDDEWFDFFEEQKSWVNINASWIVANWTSQEFCSVERLNFAIKWLKRLGKPFATALADELRRAKDLPVLWLRTWRLITLSRTSDPDNAMERSYIVEQSLKNPLVLYDDLNKAVNLLTPYLVVETRIPSLYEIPNPTDEKTLANLVYLRLHLSDLGSAPSIFKSLAALPQTRVVLSLATARLQDVIQLSIDIGDNEENYDSSAYDVPSVEPHVQNQYHDGRVYLVQLLASLASSAQENDRQFVRVLAETWKLMPSVLGARLWLHALRQKHLFSANEAMMGVYVLSMDVFWNSSPELALVLKERAADADPVEVAKIEQRILDQGDEYYSQYETQEGQVEWQHYARDAAVWLRLNMLDSSSLLTGTGSNELAAIKERHEHLRREVADSDYFGSYSTGVRMIEGDSSPILDASPEERLTVAKTVFQSPDINKRQGWNAYCRQDPQGAFEVLFRAQLDSANAPLWGGLIQSLSFPDRPHEGPHLRLVQAIFNALILADDSFVALVARQLTDLYYSTSRQQIPKYAEWWPRLLDAIEKDDRTVEIPSQLHAKAINTACGRLTQAAIDDVERSLRAHESVENELINNLGRAARMPQAQGIYARAVLVYSTKFIVKINAASVIDALTSALNQDNAEAAALRSILASASEITPSASKIFRTQILRGVLEVGVDRTGTMVAAANIIRPALSILRNDHDASNWGISLNDTAFHLRSGPSSLRDGAALLLKNWLSDIDGGPARTWLECIRPLLDKVWPRERTLNGAGQAMSFAEMAINSNEAFPDALQFLMPYMSPSNSAVNSYQLGQSKAPENFPRQTLALLWKLFGSRSRSQLYEIDKILDRIVKADPEIEFDRRLQWLNQRAVRFE